MAAAVVLLFAQRMVLGAADFTPNVYGFSCAFCLVSACCRRCRIAALCRRADPAPFLLSAVFAYVCLPPVDRIARKLPRWLAAAIVMALLVIGLAALGPIVLPLGERQFVTFLQRMPEYLDCARRIATEIDRVLGEFLRGQLLVMLLMAAYYAAGLWIADLEYSLPIGILSGLLLALPAGAAMLVALRHLRAHYFDSDLYKS